MSWQIVDQMPTLAEVEAAGGYQIVVWHLFLRPTMSNDELAVVKAIAARYDRMGPAEREAHAAQARRAHAL